MKSKQNKNISAEFRQKYGLTMTELANLCNKSRSTIMNWEYDDRCPALIKYVLKSILEQRLSCEQMIVELKEVFDKPVDSKST